MSLDLVRNKPQFDVDVLKPGVAIKYRYKCNNWINAIIINSEHDKLFIVRYDSMYEYADACLYLKDVLDDLIDIEILK